MAYAARDRSVSDGAPVEFYKFTGPFGVFRYTTSHKEETFLGEVYSPVAGLSRSAIEIGSVIDTLTTNNINLPCDDPLALLYNYGLTPRTLSVIIYRAHRGDDWTSEYSIEWTGIGTGYTTSDDIATIETSSVLQSLMAGNLASVYYQRICNHTLYDSRCKVNKADYTYSAVVTGITGPFIQVDDDHVVDGLLVSGTILCLRTGEERNIISNISDRLKIGYSFIDLIVGDVVELSLGCDHTRTGDCEHKFNNVANYGGFDFIPVENPFDDVTSQDKIVKSINKQIEEIRWWNLGMTNSG